MPTTQQLRNRLVKKLSELFQLDQPDLDFGFYRIMHAKAQDVKAFIETDLLNIVSDAFGKVDDNRKAELQTKIDHEIAAAKEYGVADPEQSPKVREARETYAAIKDASGSEADVYDHLYRFFERYYDNGDFISRRYYTHETSGKAAPFAIPYNGEEVKLHWANADQYYIKTSENFSNYSFDLRQAKEIIAAKGGMDFGEDKPLKVHFRVVDATEGEHGNVKAADSDKRFFIIHEGNPVEINEHGELVINFEYRIDPEKTGQEGTWRDKRNGEAVDTILNSIKTILHAGDEQHQMLQSYFSMLKLQAPTESNKSRTLLDRYINQYTARNTMDYFIHKDLGGFLRRELDFYIKNEVMRLDDIENADVPAVESYLAKIKVLRQIASKLIDFLAQLEDFQKKLWLKKKFVVETNYCITLDRVPEELYPEIALNDAQIEEWVRLFAIDEIQSDLESEGYSRPLPKGFLKSNHKLVLDTHFFDDSFKERLLASIENFEERCEGLLIHSENFQVLNLLQERYREQVKCVYIDPPYNTSGSGFFYKDTYKHASWLSMILDRLLLSKKLLKQDGVLYSSIDAVERSHLESALNISFGGSNRVEEVIWAQNTTKNQSPTFSTNHEYVEVFAKDIEIIKKDHSMFREIKPGFLEIMELIHELNPKYPSINEIEKSLRTLYKERKKKLIEDGIQSAEDEWKSIYNYNKVEYRDIDGRYVPEDLRKIKNSKIWVWREVDTSMPQVKGDSQKAEFRDIESPTYRFYKPIHPITGKPCQPPKTGWRWPFDAHGKQQNYFSKLAFDNRIVWGVDESKIPQQKSFLHEVETNVAKSVVNDYADGEKELTNLFGKSRSFSNPKPTTLIKRFCLQVTSENNLILDFFAGSGTTGDAVINLNREDKGQRKYILVEIGNYINDVTNPRIQKNIYSEYWKDGKPTSRHSGVSHCFKYIRLESYEDTLNNLIFDQKPGSSALLNNPSLKEDYMLRYMLDVETRGSQSLLNIDAFADPCNYTLQVKKPGTDEQAVKTVDLIETFNYLIGLRVLHIALPQSFNAVFKRTPDPELPEDQHTTLQHTKLTVDGRVQLDSEGTWWFRKIEGWVPRDPQNPNNGQRENVLIVWRKLTGDLEKDNLMLDEWFQKTRISTRDFEFDTIYVNGSNNLPNLKLDDENWKVRLIEEEFMKRMWNEEGLS